MIGIPHSRRAEPRRGVTRRELLRIAAGTALAASLPGTARALVAPRERALSFYDIHTGEHLRRVYWREDAYVQASLADIDYQLRDFRTGSVKSIDPRLLDRLYELRRALDTREPLHVVSGYRTAATNAMLAARSSGVALHSFHVKGMAIDFFLPGRDLAVVHRAALAQRAGGVGFYPSPGFVHVDVGPVRSW